MYWYNWLVENKELIKIVYGLVIGIICLFIVNKTHKLFHLSEYEGIRYLRNAFLFFGVAFIIRYVIGGVSSFLYLDSGFFSIIRILFEYFLIMAGFFLLYSLIWKKIDLETSFSSLLNAKILIFYIMAFIIALLDFLWEIYYFLFFSQIIIFVFASILSYINYVKRGKQRSFLKFYFLAMILTLVAWLLNAVTALYFDWNRGVLISVYGINIVIFLLFLFGVINLTKKSKGV